MNKEMRELFVEKFGKVSLPSAEPVAWIEVRDDGEEPDLTADPLWAKHCPGKWLPLFLHPSPADEAVRRDAERWRYVRRKLCLTGNGNGTCSMQAINLPEAIPGWPECGRVAEFCDAAIDAAIARRGEV